jgi:hypothetical protein
VIRSVFLFRNGNVAVCDEHGRQIPALQGYLGDVREKLLTEAPPDAEFNHWAFDDSLTREEFRSLTREDPHLKGETDERSTDERDAGRGA